MIAALLVAAVVSQHPSDAGVQDFGEDVIVSPTRSQPAPVVNTGRTTDAKRTVRPTQMQEMAEQSLGEITVGGTHLRYNLNVFGHTSLLGALTDGTPKLSFDLGALDLLVSGSLGDLAFLTTEFALEAGGVDLERVELELRSTSGFFVTAGRTHTRLGYWNNAFHHGVWLQSTVQRPHYIAFEDEGGLIPSHFIGVEVGKRFSLQRGDMVLRAGVGNGRGSIVDDIITGADIDLVKAVIVAVNFENVGVTGLYFGVQGMLDRIAAQGEDVRPALPNIAITEWIAHAHLAYRGEQLSLVAEGGIISHVAAGKMWLTGDAFVVAAYALGNFAPYAGVEVQRTSSDPDPFFSPGTPMSENNSPRNFVEGKLGLRYDLRTWTALKLEYVLLQREGASLSNVLRLNWSFGL